MTGLHQGHTAARLAGQPIFCVDRQYECVEEPDGRFIRYTFTFPNGYGACLVDARLRRTLARGELYLQRYKLRVDKEHPGRKFLDMVGSVVVGDENHVHLLLCEIEALEPAWDYSRVNALTYVTVELSSEESQWLDEQKFSYRLLPVTMTEMQRVYAFEHSEQAAAFKLKFGYSIDN